MEYKETAGALCGRYTFTLLHQAVKEGKHHPAGRPAGRIEGPGLRYLSHGDLSRPRWPATGQWARACRRMPSRTDHHRGQGVFQRRRSAGEFVSEIFGEEADELRRRGGDGGEYGATTGRPRRMGWLDLVASRYGCQVQGATCM